MKQRRGRSFDLKEEAQPGTQLEVLPWDVRAGRAIGSGWMGYALVTLAPPPLGSRNTC